MVPGALDRGGLSSRPQNGLSHRAAATAKLGGITPLAGVVGSSRLSALANPGPRPRDAPTTGQPKLARRRAGGGGCQSGRAGLAVEHAAGLAHHRRLGRLLGAQRRWAARLEDLVERLVLSASRPRRSPPGCSTAFRSGLDLNVVAKRQAAGLGWGGVRAFLAFTNSIHCCSSILTLYPYCWNICMRLEPSMSEIGLSLTNSRESFP